MSKNLQSAVFLGSKSLGLNALKSLHRNSPGIKWTIIHPNDFEDTRSVFVDFKNFAETHDLTIFATASASETKTLLAAMKFDIGFVCGWYLLLDAETLSSVPHGLWGIHNSLLPRYRGSSPLVWSIINGDKFVGSSVFRLSEGMDTGELLLQVAVENTIEDDIKSLLKKIEDKLLMELPSKWIDLINDQAALLSQNNHDATYCGLRNEQDGNINWEKDALTIHNFIKAQSLPYPCAFTFLGAKKILILKSRPSNLVYDGTPGQILKRCKESIFVSCGSRTAIEILEVSVDGTSMIPTNLIRSIKLRFRNSNQV